MLCLYCGQALEVTGSRFCSAECVEWHFQGLRENDQDFDPFDRDPWENTVKVPSNE